MDCKNCIHGFYKRNDDDICNEFMMDKTQYENILKTHKCPYYFIGHLMYIEHIENVRKQSKKGD